MHLRLPLFNFTHWKDKCASNSLTTKELTHSICPVSLAVKYIILAFNTTSRYLNDILNINNICSYNMVSYIYHAELQLNKANTFDTNDLVSTKNYGKRDDFDFEIDNFSF